LTPLTHFGSSGLLARLRKGAPTQRAGPLLGVSVAHGNRFSPRGAQQVTIDVDVGSLRRARPLTVDWYSIDAAGSATRLERQRETVTASDRAWFRARSRGPAPRGLYEVRARIGASERVTWFHVGDVRPPAGQPQASATAGHAELISDDQEGVPWDEFAAGKTNDQEQNPAGDPFVGGCIFHVGGGGYLGWIDAWAAPTLTDQHCGLITLSAAVTGEPVTQASGDEGAVKNIDPCDLPGGTDAAGTVVHLRGTAELGDKPQTWDVTLVDIGTPPMVAGTSTPAAGTRVHAGDTIKFRVGALEMPFSTGIKRVEFSGTNSKVREWVSPDKTPKACDKTRFIKGFEFAYVVPGNPPPVVEILVRAEDYAGHVGWESWDFPTQGATWTGSMHASLEQHVQAGRQESEAEGKVLLTEDGEGNVTGLIDGQQIQTLDLDYCPSATHSPGRIHAEVSGTRKGDVLSLELGAVDFTKPGVTPCPQGGLPFVMGSLIDPLYPPLGKALSEITKGGDGKWRADAEGTYGVMDKYTVHYVFILKREG
jgi:hypothetical protein